jgi:methylmalonyl-CoA mutase
LVLARAAGHGMVEAAIQVAGRGANLGQISCALADPEAAAKITALPLRRHAQAYERLRDACDAYQRKTGKRPSIFLCNLGTIPEHKARAQFATGCFNAGGVVAIENDGFASAQAAAQAFADSGADLAVICGTDAAYALSVAEYAPLLVARGAKRVVLAGRPAEHEASYRSAGVTDFVFTGCDIIDSLSVLLTATGVLP